MTTSMASAEDLAHTAAHTGSAPEPTALESSVRSYSRTWPTEFTHARGSVMTSADGSEYLDFFSGAGALNYGHNAPELKKVLLEHLMEDRVVHGLDMFTDVRRTFLETFRSTILEPRGLDHRGGLPRPRGEPTPSRPLSNWPGSTRAASRS
jgi:diaminobutyrate-2-oxoglutarate transaminase